jgi:ATP-binding cassette subfamily B protein
MGMADYFETDEVVKGYDRVIMRRILSYLKPYRSLAVFMLLALAVSTGGELLVPVIEQRVIDNAIMSRFLTIRTDVLERKRRGLDPAILKDLERLMSMDRVLYLEHYGFIPQDQGARLSRDAEEALKAEGILTEEAWYAFPFTETDPAFTVMEEHREIFIRGAGAAALRRGDLAGLTLGERRAVRQGNITLIIYAALGILVILGLVFVFTFIQTWTTTLIGQRVMKDMRLELLKKTVSQSTAFLSRHPVGRIVTRLTGDVETINEFFTSVLVAFLKDLSVMAGVLITLFLLSPKLALVVLITMPPVMAVTAINRAKARDAFRRQRTASSRVNSYLSERLSGVQVVQLFLGERKSAREFGGRNRELLNANLGEMYVFATFRPLVEFLATLTTAVVIVTGSVMILNISISLGVLIAFINLVGMFYAPVMDIAEKYTLLQSAMAGGERVFAFLDTDEHIPDRGRRSVEGRVEGHIEFKDVRFSYKKGEEILKGLSFSLRPGEMAAIVGYTGAGKTTIINVLTRLWDIDSGEIYLDRIPLREIPLPELRRAVLPVLQDVFLFSGTVADNIRLGLPLSDEETAQAARAVHAHEFISRLPLGYQTVLSEGAANISSGQRQLISFARVIAHNPAIVILDEATSSIDTETEHLIQLGIRRVLAGRTSIVIAHRLSTIRHADRILVLSGGRVVEQGAHQDLIDKNGLYAGLYKLQYEA